MKKILTILLLFVFGVAMVSCGKKKDESSSTQTLSAPVITLTEKTVSWSAVANASSYDVYSGTTVLNTVTTTSLDLSTVITTEGTYSITVVAKAAGYTNSAASNAVSYTCSASANLDVVPTEPEFDNCVAGHNVYVTTCGQADLTTVTNIFNKCSFSDYTSNNTLEASAVETGSVVFLVVGASNKGLSGAGATKDTEEGRASAFATRANAGEITLIVLHVGGTARRGTLSDGIINNAVSGANLMLVVSTGNADGLFTTAAEDYSSVLYEYSQVSKMVATFKYLLGKAQ